ncbi:MAG: hypothetical protein KDA89_23210 [Planctomycetaceae bacterium]|nr:hypothetical protein [Planctomycetaceae bacterium]
MAIEFHCPYCTATIRVGGELAGTVGRCPKCHTKVIVPNVRPPSHGGPGREMLPSQQPATKSPDGPQDAVAIPPVPAVDEAAAGSVRRRFKRRHGQRLTTILVPLVCFGIFLGLLAAVALLRQPELKGTLSGMTMADMNFPPAYLTLAETYLSADERAAAVAALTEEPESFRSEQLTCRISGDGDRLQIRIEIGDDYSWFTVSPAADIHLMEWIHRNTNALNTIRLQTIAAAATELCRDKLLRASGTRVVMDVTRYRDEAALANQVRAFGLVVEAVTGTRRSPCVFEDANGVLYFALPRDTRTFILRGRILRDGTQPFPGEYAVNITGSAPAPTPAETQDSVPVPPSETTEPEMTAPGISEPGMSESVKPGGGSGK